jgi:drug/metabolite transporter (DMT)-like permease
MSSDARLRFQGHLGYVMVALAALSWGTSGVFLRAAERLQPVAAAAEVAIVMGTVGAVFGGAAWLRRTGRARPPGAWMAILLLGLTDGLNNLLYFAAVQRTTLAVAVLTHYMAPLLVAAASPFVFRSRHSKITWVALALALFGLLLLLEPWKGATSARGVGAGLGLGSAVFFATSVVLIKKLEVWFSPLELLGYHCAVSGLLGWAIAPAGAFALDAAPVRVLVAQGLLLSGCGGLLFTRGLAESRADLASILLLLEPVMAVAAAAVLWAEVPGWLGGVGGLTILLAAALVIRAGSDPELSDAPA